METGVCGLGFVLATDSVRSIPREKREFEPVGQGMVSYERTVTVSPDASAADALQKMARTGLGQDSDGSW